MIKRSPPTQPEVKPSAPPAQPQPMEVKCWEAADHAEAGEHQPAVAMLGEVVEQGGTCSERVLAVIETSFRILEQADELTQRGIEARDAGDINSARRHFQSALAVYPKFYWVQKLHDELPRPESEWLIVNSSNPVAATELQEARRAQQERDLGDAVTRALNAIAAEPDGVVRDEVLDFSRRLGLKLFSGGELSQAEVLWSAALTLDPDDPQLNEYLAEVETRLRRLEQIEGDG